MFANKSQKKTREAGNASYRRAFPFAVEASQFDFERSYFLGLGIVLLLLWFRRRFRFLAGVWTCQHKTERWRSVVQRGE